MSSSLFWRDRAFSLLVASTAGGRLGEVMFGIGIVLFLVDDLERPAVAGLVVLLSSMPGLVLSPVTGRFLSGRLLLHWVCVDYALKAAAIVGIAVLGGNEATGVALMLLLALSMSLTSAFGNVGLRSYIATELPPSLRVRANAVDSVLSNAPALAGPVLVASVVTAFGSRPALIAVACVYALAAAVALGAAAFRSVRVAASSARGARGLVTAILIILRHPTLRGLSNVYFLYQAALGVLVVALPVLVAHNIQVGANWVGASWSVAGAAAIVSAVLVGRIAAEGHEVGLMAVGAAVTVVSVALLWPAASVVSLVVIFLGLGLGVAPLDIGLFGLRQKVTPPQEMTTVLAVSSSINVAGYPVGAAVGGLIAFAGPVALIGGAALFSFAAFAVSVTLLPRAARGEAAHDMDPQASE